MKPVPLAALTGACAGIIIGEYFPKLFARGLDTFGAALSEPFGGYRNDLAFKYALIGAAVAALVAYLVTQKK